MRHEFEVDLKPVRPKPQALLVSKDLPVPPIRRTLVLAYQIVDYMRDNNIRTLKEFCTSAQITRARGTQIMGTLLLAPHLQAQALTEDSPDIQALSEEALRPLLKELLWQRQEELWLSTRRSKVVVRRGNPVAAIGVP